MNSENRAAQLQPINCQLAPASGNAGSATIQPLDDHRLLLVSTELSDQGSHVFARWSEDAGRTWNRPVPILAAAGGGFEMPSLVRPPRGGLRLVLKHVDQSGATQLLTAASDDDGRTWSHPTPITPAGANWRVLNDSLIRTRDGRLILPVVQDELGCLTWISGDDGKTWRMSPSAISPKTGETCCEPSIVELPNGRVTMFLRTSNPANQIYIASSADGESGWRFDNEWGPVALDAPCLARQIPDTNDTLLLWNNHCLETNLSCAISSGPLRFWEHFHVLEEQDAWPKFNRYSHPSAVFAGDQAHLAYVETKPAGTARLIYRRLPTAWFYADAPTRAMTFDARSYLKEMWEQAPADDPNKYIREMATATFNPVNAKRPVSN